MPGASEEREGESASTGRVLLGLSAFAVFMTLLGIAVVWALTYGPLG